MRARSKRINGSVLTISGVVNQGPVEQRLVSVVRFLMPHFSIVNIISDHGETFSNRPSDWHRSNVSPIAIQRPPCLIKMRYSPLQF